MSGITFVAPDLARLESAPTPLLALFIFAERRPLQGITSLVDWRLHGHLSRMLIEGFLHGGDEETMLIPLGHRLPHEYLLVLGLGQRDDFGEKQFIAGIERLLAAGSGLDRQGVTLALPGRVEGTSTTGDAIDWFLSAYEQQDDRQPAQIIEPVGVQKAMAPAIERWRLRQILPQ